MSTSTKGSLQFYQKLGKLFFAIASADAKVNEAEYDALKEIVKSDWLEVDNFKDDFNADAAFQIEIVFDWLYAEKKYNSQRCFDEFIAFRREKKKYLQNRLIN
jgi:hypothetical protein